MCWRGAERVGWTWNKCGNGKVPPSYLRKEQRKETKFTNAEKMLIYFCYALHKYLTSTRRMAQYTVLGEPLQTRTPPLIRWAYILSAIHTHRVELYSAYNIYIVCFCHMILWGGDFILCTNIQRNDGTFVLYAQVYQTRWCSPFCPLCTYICSYLPGIFIYGTPHLIACVFCRNA